MITVVHDSATESRYSIAPIAMPSLIKKILWQQHAKN
jgi:hypothetical protein